MFDFICTYLSHSVSLSYRLLAMAHMRRAADGDIGVSTREGAEEGEEENYEQYALSNAARERVLLEAEARRRPVASASTTTLHQAPLRIDSVDFRRTVNVTANDAAKHKRTARTHRNRRRCQVNALDLRYGDANNIRLLTLSLSHTHTHTHSLSRAHSHTLARFDT